MPDPESVPGPERLSYGDDPSQWVDLRWPAGPSRGLVVVVHGGFWKAQYDASYAEPMAVDLTARGWTTALVEYRRVGEGTGGGGGWPATADDVSAAIDLAARTAGGGPVVTLGHSAGGHLAVWAAARTRFARWSGGVPVAQAISLAGVLDLTRAHADGLGSGAVERFVGGGPGDPAYDLADPSRHLPLEVPVWCVHARDDEDVPFAQSADYVARAQGARLVEVPGGHFGLVDVTHPAWSRMVEATGLAG